MSVNPTVDAPSQYGTITNLTVNIRVVSPDDPLAFIELPQGVSDTLGDELGTLRTRHPDGNAVTKDPNGSDYRFALADFSRFPDNYRVTYEWRGQHDPPPPLPPELRLPPES